MSKPWVFVDAAVIMAVRMSVISNFRLLVHHASLVDCFEVDKTAIFVVRLACLYQILEYILFYAHFEKLVFSAFNPNP